MSHAGELFQVFEQLHTASQFEGTGIGLATVKQIIEMHHGEVWAESSWCRRYALFHNWGGEDGDWIASGDLSADQSYIT